MECRETNFIHIKWSGPHTLADISSFNGEEDYGIYQVYGAHHVYGIDTLLYIGRAEKQTFSTRFTQHHWCSVNHDAGRLQVYLGRLCDDKIPTIEAWERNIRLAERLLIYAHKPAENSQKEIAAFDEELSNVHVLNWFLYRDLLPEVSGARWSGLYDHIPYKPNFSTAKAITLSPS